MASLQNGYVVSTPAELKPAPLRGNKPASDIWELAGIWDKRNDALFMLQTTLTDLLLYAVIFSAVYFY